MNLGFKLLKQAVGFGVAGGILGYFFGTRLPAETVAELAQTLGNISAIAGSILGWSVGWLSQSRHLVKEIDYEKARYLFRQLGDIQHEIIWRWGIVFGCSVLAIICAVVMKMPSLPSTPLLGLLIGTSSLLGVALGFILYLFQNMVALASLKSKLDEFEHEALRKNRLTRE